MGGGPAGNLGQMGNTYYLSVARKGAEFISEDACGAAPYPRIDLVEYHGGQRVLPRHGAFYGEHDPGDLSARGNSGEWPELLAGIWRNEKFHAVGPARVRLFRLNQRFEPGLLH